MAASYVVGFLLLLAMATHSDATYCVCNSGVDDRTLQKNIDYACGTGADCSAIHETGPCYNPNTVRDHCNYAVNSYYQRRQQVTGSCDFQGTATVTSSVPTQPSGCVYQASPSSVGSTTPGTNSNNGTNPGTFQGSTGPGIGISPTGSDGFGVNSGASLKQLPHTIVCFSLITFLVCGLLWPRI